MKWMRLAAAGLAVLVTLGVAAPAWALFSDRPSVAGNTFQTAVLRPPTGLTLRDTCPSPGPQHVVVISWTASTSTFAQGYRVQWSASSAGPWNSLATVASSPATQAVQKNRTRWYRVRAYAHNWNSTWAGPVSITLPNVNC